MGSGLFLGLTTVDILNYVDRYPGCNEKIRARNQLIYAGGPAANGAVAYAAFGNTTQLFTGLGKQPLADLAKADLKTHGVEVADWAVDPQLLPVLSSIIVDESSGDRSVVYTDTTDRKLGAESVAKDTMEGSSVLLLDGFYLPQAIHLAGLAKETGIPVVFDGGSWKEGLEYLLPLVDYAICSANFCPPGCSNKRDVVRFLRDIGIGSMAISQGGGPLYANKEGVEKDIAIEAVDVVDTLGAGDILHGAFCHFIQKSDFFDSLRYGAEIATQSCRFKGTRSWIGEVV
ncbi:MAG: sugar/nucleoside kinase (ribokinase family) [Desulforhopalus sp.]|jgi:sugar/nucleoside kinase (ribokinase family)